MAADADIPPRDASENEVSTAIYSVYDSVKKRLVAHLGPMADADINFLARTGMVAFRDALAAKLSPASARRVFKGARMIYRAARMDGIRNRAKSRPSPSSSAKLGIESKPNAF